MPHTVDGKRRGYLQRGGPFEFGLGREMAGRPVGRRGDALRHRNPRLHRIPVGERITDAVETHVGERLCSPYRSHEVIEAGVVQPGRMSGRVQEHPGLPDHLPGAVELSTEHRYPAALHHDPVTMQGYTQFVPVPLRLFPAVVGCLQFARGHPGESQVQPASGDVIRDRIRGQHRVHRLGQAFGVRMVGPSPGESRAFEFAPRRCQRPVALRRKRTRTTKLRAGLVEPAGLHTESAVADPSVHLKPVDIYRARPAPGIGGRGRAGFRHGSPQGVQLFEAQFPKGRCGHVLVDITERDRGEDACMCDMKSLVGVRIGVAHCVAAQMRKPPRRFVVVTAS